MNHVLLSGSESSQTSADAYIDGEFHGAFSYYLCRTVREAGIDVEYGELVTRVRQHLVDGQFSQVPQLEPANTHGPFLRWTRGEGGDAGGKEGGTAPPADPTMAVPAEIVDIGRQILVAVREVRDAVRAAPAQMRTASSAGGRALVYIHGICEHPRGYSDKWWNALRPHLSSDTAQELDRHRHEVRWSQWVTPQHAGRAVAATEQEEESQLAKSLKETLNDRAHREVLATAVRGVPGQRGVTPAPDEERALLGIPGLNCIDDFVKYLRRSQIRAAVQREFLNVVVPLLNEGRMVNVISHSWGTVVAYEALRQLDRGEFNGCSQLLHRGQLTLDRASEGEAPAARHGTS